MPITQLNNQLNIYYEVHGEGEPLVFINGLKSDHTGWMPLLDSLKNHFKVILLDNRGIGQTRDDGRDFTIEDMAKDVINLMDFLDISSAHIAGHSMGGAIAQVIAHQYPERVQKVFLCNTFIKFNAEASQAFSGLVALYQSGAPRRNIMERVIPLVFAANFATQELCEQIYSFVESDPFWQTAEDYQRQMNALNAFDSSRWIRNISVPVVVVGSHEDITALPEESVEIAQKIHGAVLEMLSGGHASAIEQSSAFSSLFMSHLVLLDNMKPRF